MSKPCGPGLDWDLVLESVSAEGERESFVAVVRVDVVGLRERVRLLGSVGIGFAPVASRFVMTRLRVGTV